MYMYVSKLNYILSSVLYNNNAGGREETSRKAQTEVDGQSAERFETTPARPKART